MTRAELVAEADKLLLANGWKHPRGDQAELYGLPADLKHERVTPAFPYGGAA